MEQIQSDAPLVSVIIPMYNSAKFIPQTLESLLYQTMTDFEVVIIDDCSTDNSVEVVESFAERFGGRLNLIKMPKNTGMPGLPRNEGIRQAHGKYIAFLDSDDLFTKTALEELSTLAEEYQADVVRLYGLFELFEGKTTSIDDPIATNMAELTNPKNFIFRPYYKEKFSEPFLESEDIGERVRKWTTSEILHFWRTVLFFYRRDFIVDNQILFSAMATAEDTLFAFEALCRAKIYLNVPNIVYIIRPLKGSISRDISIITLKQHIHKRLTSFKIGVEEFAKIMTKIPFFAQCPKLQYDVIAWFGKIRIEFMKNTYAKNPVHELNELVKQEFHPEDALFSAYLFNTVNLYRLKIKELEASNKKLKVANAKLKKANAALKAAK